MRSTKLIMFLVVGIFIAIWLIPLTSTAQVQKVNWADIIGIIEAGNKVGSGTGQVTGGGQPWSATSGFAQVNLKTGRLDFSVKGLVFAGGNSIGTPGPIMEVKGTLVCDTDGEDNGGNSILVDTEQVPLSERGDARFSGTVSLPLLCLTDTDIAFLIRTSSGPWIANGAVRTTTPPAVNRTIERACINSGGTAKTGLCCKSVADFPSTCSLGACGCLPDSSHEVKICDCGSGKCFDGSNCVSR